MYASVYPGKVLIYAKPSSDPKAAIRNPQLHKVLRQAGHVVTVVEDWPQLEQEMKRQVVDVLLVEVNEAARLAPLLTSSRGRPEAMYVAPSKNAVPSNVVCRLKASDGAAEVSRGNRDRHESQDETEPGVVERIWSNAMTVLRRLGTTGILSAAVLIAPAQAAAQAWVPAKGEGAIAIAAQSMNVKNHLAGTVRMAAGEIDTYVLLGDLSYGLTDKVAVDLAVPLVTSKYRGSFAHPGTDIDDGTYRSTVTDFRMSVRYNITRKGMVFTPYIGTVVPSHDYQFYGHAAAGQRLREVQVGAFAAKLIASGRLAGLFVSGRAGYGFVEQVQDGHVTQSDQRRFRGRLFPDPVTPCVRHRQRSVHPRRNRLSGLWWHGRPAAGAKDRARHHPASALRARRRRCLLRDQRFDRHVRVVRAARHRAQRPCLEQGDHDGGELGLQPVEIERQYHGHGGAPSAEYARLTGKKEGSLGRCICQKSAS